MAWKSSRKERILIWGGTKVGKTFTIIGIMEFARLTRTDSHFWIIDNDNQMAASGLTPGGEFEHLCDMATIWVPEKWEEYGDITKQIKVEAKPEDWIHLDMLSNVYGQMPDWWIEMAYGESTHGYWATVRHDIIQTQREAEAAGVKKGHEKQFGGAAGVDWQFIGKEYRQWERQLSIYSPCHVLAVSAEQEIDERWDTGGERRAAFAMTSGVQPKGEKDTAHRFHTAMRMQRRLGKDQKSVAARSLTVLGDRGRMKKWEELGGRGHTIQLGEGPRLAWDYLVKVGGWKPGGK